MTELILMSRSVLIFQILMMMAMVPHRTGETTQVEEEVVAVATSPEVDIKGEVAATRVVAEATEVAEVAEATEAAEAVAEAIKTTAVATEIAVEAVMVATEGVEVTEVTTEVVEVGETEVVIVMVVVVIKTMMMMVVKIGADKVVQPTPSDQELPDHQEVMHQ